MKERINLEVYQKTVVTVWGYGKRRYRKYILNYIVQEWCEKTLGYVPRLRSYPTPMRTYMAEFKAESDRTLFMIRFPRN